MIAQTGPRSRGKREVLSINPTVKRVKRGENRLKPGGRPLGEVIPVIPCYSRLCAPLCIPALCAGFKAGFRRV